MKRGFNFRSAFAMTFADISPIVAVYAIFTLGLFSAGPAFFWAFPIVLAGQLLVAAVFGELSSRWPFAGSVYQWARHVHSTKAGWFAAWAYIWGLTIALSAVAYGVAGFLVQILGWDDASRWQVTALALAMVALGTTGNMLGRKPLKIMLIASIICEIVGSVGLGTFLLIFHRVNSFSVLFEGFGTQGAGAWISGPLLLGVAFVGLSFLGFESAGSMAEEVEAPERNVPKAIIFGLLAVALVVMYSSLAVILSIPDLAGVMSAKSGDPVADTLAAHFGAGIGRPMLILFVIGFMSSFLAVQAAASRCVWGSARDNALPASRILSRLGGSERVPVNAVLLTGVVAAVLVLLSGSELYGVLINFTTIGFYIAFGVPVVGAALARMRGTWVPGPFSLGRWGKPITYGAVLWIIFEAVNIAWPRDRPDTPWYIDWSMVLTLVALSIVGLVVYGIKRNDIAEPIGDRLETSAESKPVASPPVEKG